MQTLKATCRDIFSRRSTWILSALLAAGLIAGILLVATLIGPNDPSAELDVAILLVPASFLLPFSFAAGAFPAGAAHSRGTIGYAYLASNRRGWELACRVGVAALMCTLVAYVAAGVGIGGAHAIVDTLSFAGGDNQSVIATTALEWLFFPLLAALTAVICGSGATSFFIWVVESFVVESVLSAVDQPWATTLLHLLPGGASGNGAAGIITLVVWVAALGAAAYTAVNKRAVK